MVKQNYSIVMHIELKTKLLVLLHLDSFGGEALLEI